MKERAVIIVMFDLSVIGNENRKAYDKFVKTLKSEGYSRYQKSVYVRLLKNHRNTEHMVKRILEYAPKTGVVSAFPIKLTDFLAIQAVGENKFDTHHFSDDIVFF